MTQDELVEMAASAGIIPWTKHEYVGGKNFSASDEGLDGDLASLIQCAKLVAEHEREACAKVCYELMLKENPYDQWNGMKLCMEAIRARGEK